MANKYLTMLDVAKINGGDDILALIEENLNVSPEITLFPSETISGTGFTTLHRVALPTSQFRLPNEGVETQKSEYANREVQCFYLDNQMEMDVAVARAATKGVDYALTLEASGQVESAMQHIGKQIWYGVGNDVKGFPGAQQVVDAAYTLDAGGTTADSGSSVYGVRVGETYGSLIFGKDTVLTMGDWKTQRITRNSKVLNAYINSLEGWTGFCWVNPNALCRLKDATNDAGCGVTDDKLADLLAKLKWTPDYWFMTRRSRRQLQRSRQATSNTSGEGKVPTVPLPTESNGIPIIITDNLLDTEALS